MRREPNRRAARIVLSLALALALAAPALAACGKRPTGLEPPPGHEEGEYPRKYPRE